MKLRFNEGAIVKFDLLDGESVAGKVLKVYDDEVEIVEQVKIVQQSSQKYFEDRSIDGKKVIHLNRQLVKSWKYIGPFESTVIVDESLTDWFTGADYNGEIINFYVNGVCKGEGKWCGDIEEHYASPIIVPEKRDDDDGGALFI